jgi:hypothetical protein
MPTVIDKSIALSRNGISITNYDSDGEIKAIEVVPKSQLRMNVIYPKPTSTVPGHQYKYIELKAYGVTILTCSDNPDYESIEVNNISVINDIEAALIGYICEE